MHNSRHINILIVHHANQQRQAEELEKHIHSIATHQYGLDISRRDLSKIGDFPSLTELHILIVLFTASLERNENLFQLIRRIEPRADLERFLVFLDHATGQPIAIPPIFHAIRAQQHHIYPVSDQVNAPLDWNRMQTGLLHDIQALLPSLAASAGEQDAQPAGGLLTRITGLWRSPRTLMVAISLALLAGLVWLASILAPEFFSSLQPRQILMGIASQPPLMEDLWLQEDFSNGNFPAGWRESNRFKGLQALSITRSLILSSIDEGLLAEGQPHTEHAVYRLESEATWPLNDMQAVEVGYQTAALMGEGSQAGLDLQIVLADNPDFFFGCRVEPSQEQTALACYIREPGQELQVAYPQGVSLDEWHTLTIQFVPRTYSLRFFLDDNYFGQSAIPSPELWRDREFFASLQVELQDLTDGSFSAVYDDFMLSRQPLAGE